MNYALTLAYDGRGFFGWQRHGEQPTVQLELERAITRAFGVHASVQGSGRTDRGAHALGQVASVRLPGNLDPAVVMESLNDTLCAAVRIHAVRVVDDAFHARSSALSKTYRYVVWNHPDLPAAQAGRVWHVPGRLDVAAMTAACPILVGDHDFASFATPTNFEQASTRRTIRQATLEQDGARLEFAFHADGFLYKMVRNLVRALVRVGEGRTEPNQLREILAARDRSSAPGTAPASGLYLVCVHYANSEIEPSSST